MPPAARRWTSPAAVSRDKLAEFCRRRHIRRLSFFGSVLREEFEPGRVPGFIRLFEIEQEFSALIGGAKPDFVTF